MKVPKFSLYGQGDVLIENAIQASLGLRKWAQLSPQEKQIALQQVENSGWLEPHSREILETIEYLNYAFLRECPGKNLHNVKPRNEYRHGLVNEPERMAAALSDFKSIWLESEDPLVLRMLSKLASRYIVGYYLQYAEDAKNEKEVENNIAFAYAKFDSFAACLNHVMEQFSVNQVLTRSGFVPQQDERITAEIYLPVIAAISNRKWKDVNTLLQDAFGEYQKGTPQGYSNSVTNAIAALEAFLQLLVNGRVGGEKFSALIPKAQKLNLIPGDVFTGKIFENIESILARERQKTGVAHPKEDYANEKNARMVLNLVMVFIQHCLQ